MRADSGGLGGTERCCEDHGHHPLAFCEEKKRTDVFPVYPDAGGSGWSGPAGTRCPAQDSSADALFPTYGNF